MTVRPEQFQVCLEAKVFAGNARVLGSAIPAMDKKYLHKRQP